MATIFTNAGATFIRDKINETPAVGVKAQWVAWGTGAGTAAKADTTLFTEASEARVSGTITVPFFDTYQVVGQITAAGTKTITEAGLFTASTVGSLVVHADFTGVPVLAADAIQLTYTIQFL